MSYRKIWTVVVMVLTIALISACGNGEEESVEPETNDTDFEITFPTIDRTNLGDNVVAEFEGGTITGEEFATFLAVQAFLNPETPINEEEYRSQIIQQHIMEKILSDQAEDEEWVNEQADHIWEQFGMIYGEELMEEAFETLQVTEADVRHMLTSMFKVESYFRESVTEEDLRDFYNDVSEELTTATFSHILIATHEGDVEIRTEEEALQEANELYEQLQAGADLNELADEHSDDPGSAGNGGRYADSNIAQLVPEFRNAILEQEINEIGQPVKTNFGYHIIRVEELDVIPFDEVKEAIRSEVVYEKYLEYFFETIPELIIEINL